MNDATEQDEPSPCTGLCRIDAASALCAGCLRTLDEIARWSRMDDATKRDVLTDLDARRQQIPSNPGSSPSSAMIAVGAPGKASRG